MSMTLEEMAANQLTIGRTLDYARFLALVYQNDGHAGTAADVFAARYARSPNVELIKKAAVTVATTSDATWAGPLAMGRSLETAFIDYLRPLTIIGRLPVRAVPFGVTVPVQSGAGVYQWVGEGAPTPLTKLAYGTVSSLTPKKVAGIICVTAELMRLSVPNAEAVLRDEIANGLAMLIDKTFVDETIATSATTPGAITNGVTPVTPSGTTPAALQKDIGTLLAQFWTNNPGATRARLVLGPNHAAMLGGATNSQTLTVDGGAYSAMPVVISANVGARIVALDAAQVLTADGGLELDLSKQAAVQLNDAPDNPATAATVLVSLWQQNLVGIKGDRMINWVRARSTAVSWLGPTAYVP